MGEQDSRTLQHDRAWCLQRSTSIISNTVRKVVVVNAARMSAACKRRLARVVWASADERTHVALGKRRKITHLASQGLATDHERVTFCL